MSEEEILRTIPTHDQPPTPPALVLPLPCLKCGTRLPYPFPAEMATPFSNQPSGGTAFRTHGNYGSTVFDEVTGRYLTITVCDPCLRRAAHDGQVMLCHDVVERTTHGEPFVPYESSDDDG